MSRKIIREFTISNMKCKINNINTIYIVCHICLCLIIFSQLLLISKATNYPEQSMLKKNGFDHCNIVCSGITWYSSRSKIIWAGFVIPQKEASTKYFMYMLNIVTITVYQWFIGIKMIEYKYHFYEVIKLIIWLVQQLKCRIYFSDLYPIDYLFCNAATIRISPIFFIQSLDAFLEKIFLRTQIWLKVFDITPKIVWRKGKYIEGKKAKLEEMRNIVNKMWKESQ